jgi:hypothetical protein
LFSKPCFAIQAAKHVFLAQLSGFIGAKSSFFALGVVLGLDFDKNY